MMHIIFIFSKLLTTKKNTIYFRVAVAVAFNLINLHFNSLTCELLSPMQATKLQLEKGCSWYSAGHLIRKYW